MFQVNLMSPSISGDWIIKAIHDYIEDTKAGQYEMAPTMAAVVEAIGALPLWCGWSGGVALRPDGELIGFLWDDPQSAKVETDPDFRFLACVACAEKYPELSGLLPPRTVDDRGYPTCKGSGKVRAFESLTNLYVIAEAQVGCRLMFRTCRVPNRSPNNCLAVELATSYLPSSLFPST